MHHARFANNPHHTTSLKRSASYLANPESGWYPSAGVLKLSRYTGPEFNNDEGEWYTFDHSWEYRAAQLSFLEVLQQADGNRLYDVLQNSPYHVDTHMQLSEMSTQQGDLGALFSALLARPSAIADRALPSQAPPPPTSPRLSTPSLHPSPSPSLQDPSVSPTRKSRTAPSTSASRARSLFSSSGAR